MTFTQTVAVQADSPERLVELLGDWDHSQRGVAPGYQRARLLADTDHPGRFVIEVEFSDEAEASRNNGRQETQDWADNLRKIADGEPEYRNYSLRYTSD